MADAFQPYMAQNLHHFPPQDVLCLRGLLEAGFSRITTLWIILIQILSYHDLAFL